jgi:hypothetical protein
MIWQWPQITLAVVWVVSTLCYVALDGKPRTGKYNFGWHMVAFVVSMTILYYGGFWTAVRP